jgi:hypothetical protein
LIRLRRSSYLGALVMLCMALSAVLANQSYVVLMDRVQHVLHHEHAPNPLAGAVVQCEHSHDKNQLHHHCGREDHPIDSAVTHQHVDSSIVYIVMAPPVVTALRQSSFVEAIVPEGLDRLEPYRLDRPPKA